MIIENLSLEELDAYEAELQRRLTENKGELRKVRVLTTAINEKITTLTITLLTQVIEANLISDVVLSHATTQNTDPVDIYFQSASINNTPMTELQLELLHEHFPDYIYEYVTSN